MHTAWVAGLAENPATPATVAERALALVPSPGDDAEWLRRLPLSPTGAAAAVGHPDPGVRATVAENPHLPADLLGRLALDPEPRVRVRCLRAAIDRDLALPVEAVAASARDVDPVIRRRTAMLPGAHHDVWQRLARDPDPTVRAAVLRFHPDLWALLTPTDRAALGGDPDPRIAEAVAAARRGDRPLPRTAAAYADEPEPARRRLAVAHADLDRDLAEALVRDPDAATRARVAGNVHLPPDLVELLATDPDPTVRLAASLAEGLTEEQRAAVEYTVPEGQPPPVPWVFERREDPRAMRRAAGSAHVLLRRAVAGLPRLPADVVQLLADDPDFEVRHTLCHACADTPHEVLLAMYASDPHRDWSLLRRMPAFARAGLARFVDDPNRRLRLAALADPEADPAVLEKLGHDPDPWVRSEAARDPRLPLARLTELLDDPDTAGAAAANPALPVAVMGDLLERVRAARTG